MQLLETERDDILYEIKEFGKLFHNSHHAREMYEESLIKYLKGLSTCKIKQDQPLDYL